MTALLDREVIPTVHKEVEPAVRFEVIGSVGAPVIAVLGGISANRHVASSPKYPAPGWWEACVGKGRTIDLAIYSVISIDWITQTPRKSHVTTYDQADALVSALDLAGIEKLHAVVGASFGGMVALAVAEKYPDRVGRAVVIGAAHESHPRTTALRVLQRRVLELGRAGNLESEAINVARGIAITSYGTADEFSTQFPSHLDPAEWCSLIENHLHSSAEPFTRSCTAGSYQTLTRSLDEHRIDPAKVSIPVTIIAVQEDSVVPVSQARELARRLGGPARLVELRSPSGHDAFLNDLDALKTHIVDALSASTSVIVRDEQPAPRRINATRAVRAGIATDLHHGAVVPPLHLSSTFAFPAFGKKGAYDYTRSGNPTRDQLAGALADLEGGASAVVTSTGMSAVALVLQLVKPGDLIIAAHDCYGGTHRILRSLAARGNFTVQFADLTCDTASALIEARRPRLLWIETPSNPLLRITDLRKAIAAGHRAGAIVTVDNTFLSPALQRPLEFGADLVIHSTTKYLNGHSDVVGGAVISADPSLGEEVAWWANCLGITGAPFDSFLTLRGVRTLAARMRVHLENAAQVSDLLEKHPAVARVYYPGLESHPSHALAASQQSGFGAMVSFELEGGVAAAEKFVNQLTCFTLAESLGGVESLVAHPATMTHASMDAEARAAAGISDSLLRLSVGIEDGSDLVADLTAALDNIGPLGAGRVANH